MPGDAHASLQRVSTLLRDKFPRVAAGLRPPAKPRAKERLASLFDGTLPKELEAWFSWHDGEKGVSADRLIQGSDWLAMSCGDVVKEFALRMRDTDTDTKWSPNWIPLFEDFSGDCIFLDRKSGQLRVWCHEKVGRRPKAYESLQDLFARLESSYRRSKKPGLVPPPPAKLHWVTARAPSALQLGKLPVGTAFRAQRGPAWSHLIVILVKVAPDRWLANQHLTLKQCLAEWKKAVLRPPAGSTLGAYYPDLRVRHEMKTTLSDIHIASSAAVTK